MGKAQEIIDAITAVATIDSHQLPEPLWVEDTEALLTARNQLDAVIATRLQAGDTRDITVAECGRTTRSWLIEEQHLSRHDTRQQLWVARMLPTHPDVAESWAAGRVNFHHVHLILSCLTALSPQWRDAAREELLSFAVDHDPGLLAALINAIKIRAGVEESAETRTQRQYQSRYLHLHDTYEGTVHLDGLLDPASAARIRAALAPLTAKAGPEDQRSLGQRHADALLALADLSTTIHHNPDLAHAAGLAPKPTQLVATIDYQQLCQQLSDRQLSTATLNGTPITPATARMLACDAGIIPAVLRGTSEVLDLGRTTRTWTTAQRRAAALRDKGCAFPLCQVGLEHCQLHHMLFWALGGPTNHHHSAYLCDFHHWLVHHTPWTITRNTAGLIEVHKT